MYNASNAARSGKNRSTAPNLRETLIVCDVLWNVGKLAELD